jgi:hypothetical protein
MAELDARHRAMPADEIGDRPEMCDEGVIPEAEIAHRAAAAPLDLGRFDEDETGAAGGETPGIHQVPGGGEAALARILVHGRDHHAVLERNVAQRQGRKQQRTGHDQPPAESLPRRAAMVQSIGIDRAREERA